MTIQEIAQRWIAAREAYKEFTDTFPQIGLKYSEAQYNRLMATYGQQLEVAGAVRRAGLKMPWIADREIFGAELFDLMTNRKEV